MKKSLGPRTMSFPLPAFLVGTYDENGKPNLMTAAWGGIVCSEPPCLAVAIRPARWTFAALHKNKAFTISIPNSALAVATDYVGLFSGKKYDKFTQAGLTAVKSELVNAPYVDESPVIIECELYKTLELGTHTLFVGQILDVKVDEHLAFEGGALDISQVDPIIYNSGGNYHKVGEAVGKAFFIGKDLK
jgi:flavin reductase (DIM6/NTAB) family NADH-FMN oxidoreductase RutF